MIQLNPKGLSLVYVMLCLIIIGITTTALIKMSHKNAIVQLRYSNSESARLAVKAGFDNAISFFESENADTQQEILTALQQWIDMDKMDDIHNPWIVGDATTNDSLTNMCKFKVQLLGFDTSTFAVTLHTQGVGQGNAKASAIGTYIIEGLGFDNKKSIVPTHALYLGSGADQICTQLRVNGSTFMNESGQFYTNGHIFNGEFRRYANGSTAQLNMQSATFNGPAYFEGGFMKFSNNRSTFKAGLGISANTFVEGSNGPIVDSVGLFLNAPMRCQNYNGNLDLEDVNLFVYGDDSDFGSMNGSNPRDGLTYLHSAGEEPLNDPGEKEGFPINIPAKLGISSELPPEIAVDIDKIKAHPHIINYAPGSTLPGISKSSQLTGGDLNTLYSKNKSKLYKSEWLILNMQSGNGSQAFMSDTSKFKERLIILVEETNINISTNLYNSGNTGITFLYLGSDKQISQMGGCDLFRGFIYANSTNDGAGTASSLIMQSNPTLHVKGSIYCVNEGHFRMQGNNPLTISYDSTVLNELGALGVFIDPNDTSTTSTDLVFKAPSLTTELLSRSF